MSDEFIAPVPDVPHMWVANFPPFNGEVLVGESDGNLYRISDYHPRLPVITPNVQANAPAGTLRLCDICGDVIEMVHDEVGWIHNDGHLEEVCGPDWKENTADTIRAAQSILLLARGKKEESE